MKKVYKTDSVNYGFSSSLRKWVFQASAFNFITPVHRGGYETAAKIAAAVTGSVKRHPNLDYVDGLAMTAITKINHA